VGQWDRVDLEAHEGREQGVDDLVVGCAGGDVTLPAGLFEAAAHLLAPGADGLLVDLGHARVMNGGVPEGDDRAGFEEAHVVERHDLQAEQAQGRRSGGVADGPPGADVGALEDEHAAGAHDAGVREHSVEAAVLTCDRVDQPRWRRAGSPRCADLRREDSTLARRLPSAYGLVSNEFL
jgi:hypothetical protein